MYRQLQAVSHSETLVLTGDLNHPDICYMGNTAWHKKSKRFLEGIHDNFLNQVTEKPMRRGPLLDLILTSNERLAADGRVKCSPGCSQHEIGDFRVLRGGSRTKGKLTTLDFTRTDSGLFKHLLGRVPWDKVPE